MAETAGFKPRLCELLPYRKATGSLKYFHDKYNSKTQFAEHQKYVDTFEEAMQYNEQIKPHVNKVLAKPPGIAFQPCQACPCLSCRKTSGRNASMLSVPELLSWSTFALPHTVADQANADSSSLHGLWVLQVADDLSPLRVLALFSAITAEDCILLDVADRPEYLIMTHIPVPPVCIRPSVEMDSGQGSNEDDLTVRLRVGTPPFLYLPGKSLYTFHLTQVPHPNCLPLV